MPSNRAPCPLCKVEYSTKGLPNHLASCKRKHAGQLHDNEYLSNQAAVLESNKGLGDSGVPSVSTFPTSTPIPELALDSEHEEASHGLDTAVHGIMDSDEERLEHQEDQELEAWNFDSARHGSPRSSISSEIEDKIPRPRPFKLVDRPANPPPTDDLEVNSIFTEYHPGSGRASQTFSFHEHGHLNAPHMPPEEEPWKPAFRTRLDFELCELALEACLNKPQMVKFIKLINLAIDAGRDSERGFTISSQEEAQTLWELAAKQHVPFQKAEVEVEYKSEPRTFPFKFRDPWDWVLEMIKDERLAPNIAWEAQRMFQWNGTDFERFVDEPWTAEAFWEAQSELPEGASPVAFILYADKSKLSSFGTAKAHPIIARFGNLPTKIRNGEGRGGGRVVGWLPIVPEDTQETGKPGFVNFKNAVWHASFLKFLESLVEHASTGSWTKCGDGMPRWLWPIILIVSADYEENTTISLTRGLKGKLPCPVCLVPSEELSNLKKSHPLRSQKSSELIYTMAISQPTSKEAENILKKSSLRKVENAFWSIPRCDIHQAISYDCLHCDDNGLWEDHFFPQFKAIINKRDDRVKIDNQFNRVPSWSGLNHFDRVMNITFNDGSKNRDISSAFLYTSICVLGRDRNTEGYFLLKCLRSYLNTRMYADFELHTSSSISVGRQELAKFAGLMEDYIGFCSQRRAPGDDYGSDDQNQDTNAAQGTEPGALNPRSDDGTSDSELEHQTKSWNFPKMHMRIHLFDDIISKGVTRNYSTKPNEKMHGPIRKSYLRRTNFKNYGDKILQTDEFLVASAYIRSNLDHLDDWMAEKDEEATCVPAPIPTLSTSESLSQSSNTSEFEATRTLGSSLEPITFEDLEAERRDDRAFRRFRIRLQGWLTAFLCAYNIISRTTTINLKKTESIVIHRLLRARYTSYSDWKLKTDRIRANPCFHGKPRFDHVLVHSDPPYFAQLRLMFTCTVNGREYPIAYVQPLVSVYKHANRPERDKDLELLRLRRTNTVNAEFISVHSILRGVVAVPAGEEGMYLDDLFVYDLLDPDMFLRGREELARIAGD